MVPFASAVVAWAVAGLGSASRSGVSTRECLVNRGYCEADECLGSEWGCYNQSNTPVGGTQVYRIRNARWPEWYLELREYRYNWLSAVGKGRGRAAGKNFQWTIMKLPSKPVAPAQKAYMMFTERLRDHAMGVSMTQCGYHANVTADQVEGAAASAAEQPEVVESEAGSGNTSAYCQQQLAGAAVKIEGAATSYKEVTIKFSRAPQDSGNPAAPLVMINALNFPNEYLCAFRANTFRTAYDSELVSTCRGTSSSPGFHAYWFFDPPLPSDDMAEFPAYPGQVCQSGCGSMGEINDIGTVYLNKAVTASSALSLLLLLGLMMARW